MKMVSRRRPLLFWNAVGASVLCALAFAAVPAIASAAQLTHKMKGKSVAVPVGTAINGVSTNFAWAIPGVGTIGCESAELDGTVTTNSGGRVVVAGEGRSEPAGGCIFGGSRAYIQTALTSIELSSSSNVAAFDFEMLTEAGFITEGSVSTVTYASGNSSIHVAGPLTGPIPAEISGDFTLSDSTGAVTVK